MAGTDFETMVDLNPQLGRQLRLLAQSPEVVTFVTCIRSDFTGPNRDSTERAYLEAGEHPLGRQALLLFGFDRMLRIDAKDMASAWQIYRTTRDPQERVRDE